MFSHALVPIRLVLEDHVGSAAHAHMSKVQAAALVEVAAASSDVLSAELADLSATATSIKWAGKDIMVVLDAFSPPEKKPRARRRFQQDWTCVMAYGDESFWQTFEAANAEGKFADVGELGDPYRTTVPDGTHSEVVDRRLDSIYTQRSADGQHEFGNEDLQHGARENCVRCCQEKTPRPSSALGAVAERPDATVGQARVVVQECFRTWQGSDSAAGNVLRTAGPALQPILRLPRRRQGGCLRHQRRHGGTKPPCIASARIFAEPPRRIRHRADRGRCSQTNDDNGGSTATYDGDDRWRRSRRDEVATYEPANARGQATSGCSASGIGG